MKAIYTGATDKQIRWGNCADPRNLLEIGQSYVVEMRHIYSWHTKLKLKGVAGLFNDVSFEVVR